MATTKQPLTLAKRIGLKIRDARTAKRLSQAELAKRTGKLQSQISEWETGDSEPQVSTLIAIASALGVNPGDFLAR